MNYSLKYHKYSSILTVFPLKHVSGVYYFITWEELRPALNLYRYWNAVRNVQICTWTSWWGNFIVFFVSVVFSQFTHSTDSSLLFKKKGCFNCMLNENKSTCVFINCKTFCSYVCVSAELNSCRLDAAAVIWLAKESVTFVSQICSDVRPK